MTLAVLPGRLLVLHNSVAELVCMSALWQLQALGNISTLTQCGILGSECKVRQLCTPCTSCTSCLQCRGNATACYFRPNPITLATCTTRWSSEHVIRGQVITGSVASDCSQLWCLLLIASPVRYAGSISGCTHTNDTLVTIRLLICRTWVLLSEHNELRLSTSNLLSHTVWHFIMYQHAAQSQP